MKAFLRNVILCLTGIFFLYPIAEIGLRSLTDGQYARLFFENTPYFRFHFNSLTYGFIASLLGTVIALPLGYVFARVQFPLKKAVFFLYVIVMLLPFQALQLPEYVMMERIGILDTPLAVILPVCFSPLAAFLLRQCFSSLPEEQADAFWMESSSRVRFWLHILFPWSKPMIITLLLLLFGQAYNLVEQVAVLVPTNLEAYPLAPLIARLPENAAGAGEAWFLLPPLILYLIFERRLREGMQYYRWN
ncbi:MAG: carbohydrate ABC transporter permease [Lachnospiraceae bacterium]|nr:carbohydrate ABC transporter permease [Lachnospiraceae bacterium]